jgi:hypothetical protein
MIQVNIGGVDSETNTSINCKSPVAALQFLKKHDHEGSSVYISITVDVEEGYKLLEFLKELRNE